MGHAQHWQAAVATGITLAIGCWSTQARGAVYVEDFESYPDGALLFDEDGEWTSYSEHDGGTPGELLGWRVVSNPGIGPTGLFAVRGNPGAVREYDWAKWHIRGSEPVERLYLGFNYLLQAKFRADVSISADNANWVVVASVEDETPLTLIPRESNSLTDFAWGDITAQAHEAGITDDFYIRFMGWHVNWNGEWHWFAIDNVNVMVNEVPEPGQLILLPLTVVALMRRASRSQASRV